MKKEKKLSKDLKASTVFTIKIKSYSYEYLDDQGVRHYHPGSPCERQISEEEYNSLVAAGCKHARIDKIVFSQVALDDIPFIGEAKILQYIKTYTVYVDGAHHTNFVEWDDSSIKHLK